MKPKPSLLLLLAGVLLGTALSAQTLPGSYEQRGNAAVQVTIVQVPGWNLYIGVVIVNGAIIEDETFSISPLPNSPNEYWWKNGRGTEGTIKQNPNGSLENEVRTGPNAGRKTSWDKKS